MAAVWVAIFVFNVATGGRETVVAGNSPPPTPEVMMALKEQRRMMAQLLDAGAADAVARPRVPGPRSEQRQAFVVC
jgi:hypothetical protein